MSAGREKPRVRDLEEAERLLRGRGLYLTVQRRLVLETVLGRMDHPSAERVYREIRASHPEVSRATVYRTLEKLADLGLLGKVCHPGPATRYDPKTERHHHLVCTRCERVIDWTAPGLDAIPLPTRAPGGFQVRDYSIHFRGLCGECRRRPSGRQGKRHPGGRARPGCGRNQ